MTWRTHPYRATENSDRKFGALVTAQPDRKMQQLFRYTMELTRRRQSVSPPVLSN